MVKKITLLLLALFVLNSFSQSSIPEDQYNSFPSRNFMKFSSFLTVPTFSLLHGDGQTIEAISRSSNIQFQDASRLHILSYSGKMRENVGAGVAIFQQGVGVFKDFGAVANYAYQIQMGAESKLTFGFNFFYSRRGLDIGVVISQPKDQVVNNYQDKPVVVFQPAVTYSYGKFYGGLFLENLADFNMKESDFVTPFSEKTISAHVGYATNFENFSGILSNTSLRIFGVARKSKLDGFSYAGNVLVNVPKAGWVKAGYDKMFGLNAGLGVNLSERLSIGFAYEKQKKLGGTNEVGLIYRLGKRRVTPKSEEPRPEVEVVLPENRPESIDRPESTVEKRVEKYKSPKNNDLSDKIRIAQDSINKLNKKVDEVLKLLKEKPAPTQPIIIRDTVKVETEPKDTSLRRSTRTPWRNKTVRRTRTGGGGIGYFVAVNQFKDLAKAKKVVAKFRRKKVRVKTVKDPKLGYNYIYIDRFSRKKDADRLVKDINGEGKKGFEDNKENDLGIKIKSVSQDPVYVVKIDFGSGRKETYRQLKKNPPAKVRTMNLMEGLTPGYYLQVSVHKTKPYADKFVDELRADGFEANYFINPKTGYRHVYIYKTDNREEIIKLYNNNYNNSFYNRKNIIHIR